VVCVYRQNVIYLFEKFTRYGHYADEVEDIGLIGVRPTPRAEAPRS